MYITKFAFVLHFENVELKHNSSIDFFYLDTLI